MPRNSYVTSQYAVPRTVRAPLVVSRALLTRKQINRTAYYCEGELEQTNLVAFCPAALVRRGVYWTG
jgi:hypothetical protein